MRCWNGKGERTMENKQTNKQTDFANQGDTISRQAAIDAMKEHRALYCDNTPDTFSKLSYAEKSRVDELDTAIATLVNLPSAQPDHIGDVTEMVGNTISRQDVIDSIVAWTVEDRPDIEMPTDLIGRIKALPSAHPDLDSAYTEGYTQAEAKYRKMWDEMQANIKEKAFGKRKGLIHTADIYAMPTIEYRKTGKWINAYPDIEPNPMLMYGICSACGFKQSISDKLKYCPHCGARMVQEGEDND